MQRHLPVGQLKTYVDGAAPQKQAEQIQLHLERCSLCRNKAITLKVRGEKVRQQLEHTADIDEQPVISSAAAQIRFNQLRKMKEKENMIQKVFQQPNRARWLAASLVFMFALAFAFPSVRAIGNSFLGLFRVQHFAVVQVSFSNLPEQMGDSAALESIFSRDVQMEQLGEVEDVPTIEEAVQKVNYPVRLPQGMNGSRQLSVLPGMHTSFTVDVKKINLLLKEIKREDIILPDGLDGALVTADMQRGVLAKYGECEYNAETLREEGMDPDEPWLPRCTSLLQMPSPEVVSPEGLDINGIAQAFFQLIGMSQDEAEHFSQNIDWATTLVVPIPQSGTTYRDLPVDGVMGTIILKEMGNHETQYLLLWVKDGMFYALTGPGNIDTASRLTRSLK
jgi:hypothetical protein